MRKVLYFLGQLRDRDVDWLAQIGAKERYRAGSSIIEEGRAMDAMFIVIDGAFRVERKDGTVFAGRIGVGELLGEISFVDSRPPSVGVRAVEDSLVLAVPRQELEARLRADEGFAARFYRAIALMLAYRLRLRSSGETGTAASAPGGRDDSDELDENVLDNLSLAGSRFERMLQQLSAG